MNRVLFISDLDGTLLNRGAKLSEKTVSVVNRLAVDGMLFTYATARSFVTAKRVTEDLNLLVPVITYNGAFLVNPVDGEIIESCVMEKDEIKSILHEIENRRMTPLIYAIDECYAVANATFELKEFATGIIDSNDNDGVAKFIEEWLMRNI